jgi:hypothetical protein
METMENNERREKAMALTMALGKTLEKHTPGMILEMIANALSTVLSYMLANLPEEKRAAYYTLLAHKSEEALRISKLLGTRGAIIREPEVE